MAGWALILALIRGSSYLYFVAQMTIYLDPETEKKVRAAAERDDMSLSKWAGQQLAKAAGAGSWPEGYFELFGSVDDSAWRLGAKRFHPWDSRFVLAVYRQFP